jgi:hypothetical protein
MSDNAFLAESPAPDPAVIAAALGPAHPWYEGVLEAAEGFQRDWKHYGKKYGWKLKIHDGDKALLELTVLAGAFRLGLAVRERELEALRADPVAQPIVAALISGKAKEGWGLRVEVRDEASQAQALVLVRALAALRAAI